MAQSTPAPAPPPCPAAGQSSDKSQPCTPPAATGTKPSAAQQFPFPGAANKPAAAPDAPSAAPDSPAPSSGSTTPSSAAAEHPFPTAPPPKLPWDDSSSSSSSSSRGDDPSADAPDDPAAVSKGDPPEGTSVHRKLPKVQRVQTDDERVDEDLRVAKFYMRDDNLPGAYLRAKDAVKVQPDYSAGHFALGEIAQKMKKKDEAVAEYQTYLKLDPAGEKAKAARLALEQLQ